ncbi:hypothetical protein EMIHUDRAFT_198668 [Emiliania huxleyi CCMP1516]|uniref:MATH domain-containing protein n=2 Tax=Emiliania huxleyi TaxID=2903 RepID=A0A0D3I7N9_EMIH1|nr:hypothetical protein EMIHUDRAFT_198668 [Emiliania huxleyi CCMP1516]EOD07274.1 hypothetical protein EMIHUDRAFT_198668 [Emiliania huxleyi CCMP1516]|eukprot:XP_005759703.1 hypothetical protein EMIHUDRAFT_198668 [Emiliania huxleyi CCMP1516]
MGDFQWAWKVTSARAAGEENFELGLPFTLDHAHAKGVFSHFNESPESIVCHLHIKPNRNTRSY